MTTVQNNLKSCRQDELFWTFDPVDQERAAPSLAESSS